ncbi:MAG: hypothetical protein ACXVRL_14115 [Gaiellaceae bacterium]
MNAPASHRPLDGQLALFDAPTARRKRYVPTYAGDFSATHARLDAIRAQFRGLKPYEGRCHGCGKIISSKAPNCGRRSCPAVFKNWSRDQRRVVAEALRAYGGLLLLSDVTLPGTPEHERHRRRVALPWADLQRTRVEAKALYKANRRFQRRMRWLKRKAYNDARSVLTKAGYEYKSLPPVLVGNLEPQRRGALHAHLAPPYTTPLEMTFTRAFIDSMKRWAPLCGLGHVQGWLAAEKPAVIGHERAIGYMTKYLTGKHPPEFLRSVSGPVVTVSRSLTRKTGVTMQMLRKTRRLWSARQGRCEMPNWSPDELAAVAQLLDSRHEHARAP